MSITTVAHQSATRLRHTDVVWSVAAVRRGSTVAHVVRHLDSLEVRVGDGVVGSQGRQPSAAFASLHDDGSLMVETEAAPPALWLQAGGTWLLPSGADTPDPRLRARDRLLILSAGALEAEPSGLVDLLAMPAHSVLSVPPHELLTLVLPDDGPGAAAVIWRSAAT